MDIKEVKGLPPYESLIDLINLIWPAQFGEKTKEQKIREYQKSHDLKRDTFKILEADSKTIGFYRYTLWPREDRAPQTAHILDIVISRDFQKKNLGSGLMEDLIRDCKQKGLSQILSRTFSDNPASIRLHKKSGFTESFHKGDSILWELKLK